MPRTQITDKFGQPLAVGGDERARIWQSRIQAANEYYDIWARKYEVEKLEKYYYGEQWETDVYENAYVPYTSNRFFVAIDVLMPSLLFQNPQFTVKPKPAKADFDLEGAGQRAKLRQDMLNFLFSANQFEWGMELDLALLNSMFAFGLIEVMFTTDWIENPNAGKPVRLSDYETGVAIDEDELIKAPARLPTKEQVVLKRIPSKRFRVTTLDHPNINKCGWFAYWEYYDRRDVEANKNYDTSEWNIITTRSADFTEEEALHEEMEEQVKSGDLVKIWKIFDTRTKTIEYWPEGHDNIIRTRKFKHNPIVPLKFRHRLDTFYPLPLTYNWKSPQDELNDIRETDRVHRRRFVRKFVAAANAFEEEELDKIQFGGDGAIAKTKLADARAALSAMPNADLGAHQFKGSVDAIQDFDNIAGVHAPQRGEVSGGTATETKIVDRRSSIRESRNRVIFAQFLSQIAKLVLLEIKDRTTLDFWIKVGLDQSDDESQLAEIQEQWMKVTKDDLTSDEDFDVDVTVTSLSPVTRQEDKQDFIEFLSIIQQFPILSMSPHLIREAADKLNYRNENVIRVFQKLAQAIMLQQIAQAEGTLQDAISGGAGTGSGQLGQKTVAQNSPNTEEQIRNQLSNQSTQVQ